MEFGSRSTGLNTALLTKMSREAGGNNPETVKKLAEFKLRKIQTMRDNIIIHELGHLLGLAHNFSEKEKSVMSYNGQTALSDYDKAALKFLYLKEKPSRSFEVRDRPAEGGSAID